ncbi:MAG TPA: carboxymuconolactone decarboxylase family protein [Bauldia sp.]|nr:carboxymuconolactone decarboxylase family protein [Bauldia sp.]
MDHRATAKTVSDSAAALAAAIPETMRGFSALGKGAYADGALSRKHKELIALALSVASRCDGCVAYHAKRVAELGASRAEVSEVLGVAIQMGGGPSMVYGGEALRAFDTFAVTEAAA